jgi:hypothetical protein
MQRITASDLEVSIMYADVMWALRLTTLGLLAQTAISETIPLTKQDCLKRRLSREEVAEFYSVPNVFKTLSNLVSQTYKAPVVICIKYEESTPFLHCRFQWIQKHR